MDPNRLNSANDVKRSIIFDEPTKSSATAQSQPMQPTSQRQSPPKLQRIFWAYPSKPTMYVEEVDDETGFEVFAPSRYSIT